MYQWIESETWLSQYALRLKSADAVFTVHYWGVVEQHFSNSIHKHSFFEICYVLEGEGVYIDEGVMYPLSKGMIFCSRPGIYHQIQSELGMQLLFVAFELDESSSSELACSNVHTLTETETICMHDVDDLPAALLWRSLLRRTDLRSSIPEMVIADLAGALLLSLVSLFNKPSMLERPAPRRNSATLLKQAKLYIVDNLSDSNLSLGKVASHINISPRQLSRIFSEGILESFTDYVRKQRVLQAGELLRNSELSIKTIAEMTGFGSVHYFTRTFGSLLRSTPARFRENAHRND
jgi:AraC family L-rhamnose operon transcriptional activator RhaR